MEVKASRIFRLYLFFLAGFRPLYRWVKKKWPAFVERRLGEAVDLDTSRMLRRFNALHRWFFRRGFEKIRFDEEELKTLQAAFHKGPVVFLMKSWGQVEYNYFNHLFLEKKLPLVAHNNLIKMGHWMPWATYKPMRRQKTDRFFVEKAWPYNDQLFELTPTLREKKPVLYCLDLPKGSIWIEKNLEVQEGIIGEWMKAQEQLDRPIHLVPLNFIYDKHPGKERKTLSEIFLGDRENPSLMRKILLFLRNYKKRAVAKIGDPIDFQKVLAEYPNASPADKTKGILRILQRAFEHETLQVTGPKLKSRRSLMEDVLERPQLHDTLKTIAKQSGEPLEKIEQRAQKNLSEICSDIRYTLIELWNYFLTWLFNRFYEGLEVDPAGIAEIKKVAKDAPLVLIPSHKSHVDYLIFSYVFYHNDLSLPLVCAGDNLSFWPLGPVFRRSGAYFIRRSFAGDPVYRATLKNYVAQLMHDRIFQEFFIEGTRSRSGKLFPARTGMLSMMVEAFMEDKSIRDVFLVPASIDYERVIEEGAYLDEVKGGKKEKERFRDLLHLPKFLRKRYGKVYVQFAKPISLKAALKQKSVRNAEDDAAFYAFNKQLALEISHAINEVTTLLPSALVAVVLLYPKFKSVTSKEVHSKAEILFAAAKSFSPRLTEGLEDNFHHAIQDGLNQLVSEGIIQAHQSLEEKFYAISDEARLALDFYKNRGIHVLVDEALGQLCQMRGQNSSGFSSQELFEQGKRLLDREFFFTQSFELSQAPKDPVWLHEVILPTLESYWLTLRTTAKISFRKMEEWLLLRKVLEEGKMLLLKGTLNYPEALSRFNIQNALGKFTEMGVLQHHAKEMGPKGKKVYSPGATAQKREEVEGLLGQLLNK